jgi:NAD(P) transhydrogenase subunit alpha
MQFKGLKIGVPKEVMSGERRVAVIPDTVKKLTAEGAKVLIEKGAGIGSYFSDEEYLNAGAQIVDSTEKTYAAADIIMKVKEPLFNSQENKREVDMMHENQVLVTFLHPAAPCNHQMVKDLAAKKVISFTLDSVPRISRAQSMDALTSMSTVAGYKGMLSAADRLPKFIPMIGTAAGMIRPATVLVIGAGVAGLQAIATAKRLGAVTHAVDIRPDAVEQAASLGAKVIETGVPADIAVAEGGYARHLPQEWLTKEREAITDIVSKADIIILTALVPGKVAPVLLTKEMVLTMKPGSIIVDIAIDQGGNCLLSAGGEIKEFNGIIIDGSKNIPARVPVSSTWMFANNIYSFVAYLYKDGSLVIDQEDEITGKSLVTRNGQIVHAGALEAINNY